MSKILYMLKLSPNNEDVIYKCVESTLEAQLIAGDFCKEKVASDPSSKPSSVFTEDGTIEVELEDNTYTFYVVEAELVKRI